MNFSSNTVIIKPVSSAMSGLTSLLEIGRGMQNSNTCLFPLNIHFNSHFIIVLHNQIPFDLIYKKLYNGIKNE